MTNDNSVTKCEIPGGWTERELEIEGHRLRVVLATDPDRFLDDFTEDPAAPPELRDPYWARLWPVSERFAGYLLRAELPTAEPVVEIGCGLGLTGLALLVRGRRVVFTDYVPLAVQAACENADRNGFQGAGRVVDWCRPPDEKWPFVVGSDLVYDRTLHPPLLKFLAQVLPAGGQCWLSDPGRTISREFITSAMQYGFRVQLRDHDQRPSEPAPIGGFQVIEVHQRNTECD